MSSTEKDKNERRKRQNREAQRKFRLKKALVVTELEDKVTKFENKAIALKHEVSELQKSNTVLRVQVQDLIDTLSSAHDASNRCDLETQLTRSPKPALPASPNVLDGVEAQSYAPEDILTVASPQSGSMKSTVSFEPHRPGVSHESISQSIIPEDSCDNEIHSPGHVSPPEPATSLGTLQLSGEIRRLFDESLDGSDGSDVSGLHKLSSWQTDLEPVAADIQKSQIDSQNTFTPDLFDVLPGSQIHGNSQKSASSLQVSFPTTYHAFDIPHLQQNGDVNVEWPPIEPFGATTSMSTLPCNEVAPVDIVAEAYDALHHEWSLSAPRAINLFAPREHFANRVLPNPSLNGTPQYDGFNYAMYYPSLYACADQQPRQYQNHPATYPPMPLYDPLWPTTDVIPFGKSYFGHNLAVT